MKHSYILKNPATRSVIFAAILILGIVGVSHAQTSMNAQGGAQLLAQAGSSDGQPASGWKGPVTGQATTAPAQAAPAQADPSAGWSSVGQTFGSSGSCRHATPEQESFLCKVVRILYRSESPRRGPNRDMDENISAGGAGG
jgi:hypothetical protein